MVSSASLFFHQIQSRIGGVASRSSRLSPRPSLREASTSTSIIASPSRQRASASLVRFAPFRAFTRACTLWDTGKEAGFIGPQRHGSDRTSFRRRTKDLGQR